MKNTISIAVAMFALVSAAAFADVVAAWDVNGIELDAGAGIEPGGAPYTFNATTGSGFVSAQMTLSDQVSRSTSADQYGFKISSGDETTSLAEAIVSEHYFQFELQIADGYSLDVDSIEMNGQSSSVGCSAVAVLSSVYGFAAEHEILSISGIAGETGGFDTDPSGFGGPIELTDPNYAGLKGTVSFRLYGWDSSSGSGVTYLRNLSGDDLIINGTVEAIPEPAVVGFISLSSLGLLITRRWFR